MAQSALTVTPPSPTPPTNMSCTGATSPNPPNYTKTQYANLFNMDANGRPQAPYGVNPNPPPYFDDGTAGSLILFAANTSALASGSGATAGGTEGSYPGAAAGAVPASTSVAHEAAGTETSSTWGSAAWPTTAPANVLNPAGTPTMVGVGPALTAASIALGPNGSHASTLSPATNPALSSVGVASSVSGTGTTLLTCTGTNFVQGCRIWVNNVEKPTTWVSATSLTSTIDKKREAGTWPVDVKLGGVAVPSTRTLTWT